jgi:uncharacterized membrane protein (Fun14 family)
VVWFFVSIGIGIIPLLLAYFANKNAIREFLIYEAGGFGLFTPLWLIIFTDISGDSWTVLFLEGIYDGMIGPGPAGTIIGMDISNVILIPILLLCLIIGIIFLRPSFIAKHGVVGEVTELRELKESTESVMVTIVDSSEHIDVDTEDPIEYEMPEVVPPKATADTMADLRGLLTELGTPEPTINLIFNAGIATTTDLVATSPEQLSTITGIDRRTAEDLHMSVQKKVWFGGI